MISSPNDKPSPGIADLVEFDRTWVHGLVPPAVATVAILVHLSPLGFLLKGFAVWTHEFGHATVAWMTGYIAVPLPFGLTVHGSQRNPIVYFVVLALLSTLGVVAVRERKWTVLAIATFLVGAQALMTWRMSTQQAELWRIFGGIGGEFVLSSILIALFHVDFPEKFKWGTCRYVALFVGSATFFDSYWFWRRVRLGQEDIPYGSMIEGEDDAGGDMNLLKDQFHWTQHDIIHAYVRLGTACLVGMALVYTISIVVGLARRFASPAQH